MFESPSVTSKRNRKRDEPRKKGKRAKHLPPEETVSQSPYNNIEPCSMSCWHVSEVNLEVKE